MTNKSLIFDKIRRKYVALTPEEEVRQLTINILNQEFNYPLTRFSLEAQINVGKTSKRYDIIVRDKQSKPFMLIECKAKQVPITEKTFLQATNYNIEVKAPYLLLTNSITTIIFHHTPNGYIQIKQIPPID
ncbi:MAG: type I restriction enzyme HsdR N-terminal domain-containing protein [Bacteroidota bacterium]|nr:type I restriction enzyme HsdR N-terminal domain-containing protein [Bacteroidota bacterium]